jgi:hypothetical protein
MRGRRAHADADVPTEGLADAEVPAPASSAVGGLRHRLGLERRGWWRPLLVVAVAALVVAGSADAFGNDPAARTAALAAGVLGAVAVTACLWSGRVPGRSAS